jgi:hypothetical protein
MVKDDSQIRTGLYVVMFENLQVKDYWIKLMAKHKNLDTQHKNQR